MIKTLLIAVFILGSSIKSFAQIKSEPENEKYTQELKEKADSGDAEAQYKIGRCYYFGCGIAKIRKKLFSGT
jgi:TPR repeat protein